MTLGDVRTAFTNLLNQRNATPALVTTFLSQGLSRLQRVLRIPSMERAHYVTSETTAIESFEVPVDLLQIMDVFAAGRPLEKQAFRQLQVRKARDGAAVDQPCIYARVGSSIFLYPALPAGAECVVTYYGEFSPLADDTASNEVTSAIPDVMIYSALAFAGQYFKHDMADQWEATYEKLASEVADQAAQLDMTGGTMAVQAAYGDL